MTQRRGSAAPTGAATYSWLVTLLIAVAAILGLAGLSIVIDYDTWVRTVILTVLAVAGIVALARRRTRSRWIPTAIGAAAGLMLLIWDYAARPDGSHHVLPTVGALRDLSEALSGGALHIENSTIPVVATPGFAALIAATLLTVFLIAEHLTVSWGLTATAGVLLLLPWLPAAILQHQISITMLVVAIACWAGAMVLTRRDASPSRHRVLAGAATAVAGVVALAILAAPVAIGAPGWGAIPRFQTPGSLDGTTRLNLALDLRSSLTTKSATTVMVYGTSGKRPETLRLYTLTDFDGNSWQREEPTDQAISATDGVLWPTSVDDWESRERERLDIQVRGLSERNLPLPSAPRTVEVDPSWSYVSSLDEATSPTSTTKNLFYSVVTDLDYHQKDNLLEAQSSIAAGMDSQVDPRYLDIAPAIDLDRVQTVALNVTERAETRYDQALALQQFLRSPLNFHYDTTVTPTGDDSVSEFLNSQSGYCVQFGTTMVMMARSIGIPARLAVGFLGGELNADSDAYVVRGADAHAWPELYFGDQGWVRFEPTPAVQTGTPPQYADPTAGASQSTPYMPDGRAPVDPDAMTNPQTNNGTTAGSSNQQSPAIGVWVAAVLVIVLAGLAVANWWRRRSRAAGELSEPERAWRILSDGLSPSIGWPSALTPLEAADHVDAGLRPWHVRLSDDGSAALDRVTVAVSDSRYGAHPSADTSTGALEADSRLVVAEVEHAIKGKPSLR